MTPTITATATAVVLHGPKDLRIEQAPLAPPSPGHLQISIRSTTLCGSDLHYYNHFRNGNIICRHPLALGHESSGVVVALPEGYQGEFKVGDVVALEVGLPCGKCRFCVGDDDEGRGGSNEKTQGASSKQPQQQQQQQQQPKGKRYNICPTLRFRSSAKSNPHVWGTLQDRINHPVEWCYKINSPVSHTAAALMEPLAVAVHANTRAGSVAGKRVLVVGAGAVGLLVAAVVKAYKAAEIVLADINARRVAFGVEELRWGSKGYTVDPAGSPEDAAAAVKALLSPAKYDDGLDGFDAVFECSGAPASVRTSIYACNPGGTVVLIGMGTPEMTLPISAAALREVDLKGSFRYAKGDYEEAKRLLESREVEGVERLVTHRFSGLEGVKDAFEAAGEGVDKSGKLVVKVECVFGEEEGEGK